MVLRRPALVFPDMAATAKVVACDIIYFSWMDSVIFKCYLDPISIVRLLTSALNHLLNRREAGSKNRLMTQKSEFIMAVGQETRNRLNRSQGGFESNPKSSSKKEFL